MRRNRAPLVLLSLIAAACLAQETAHRTGTLLILHVNDLHDIIKAPSGNTLGGMATIAAYVKQLRAQRKDVLMVDAGDLLEKGDMLGVVSKGECTYRALGAIGCDVSVPGNHDFVYSMDQLMANIKASGIPVICAGVVYEDTGEPVFQETLEKTVNGLRVGIIGATVWTQGNIRYQGRAVRKMMVPELGQRVDKLAREMEPRVDMTLVVFHQGLYACQRLAELAPTVDVVVGGHTNEVTEQPIVAKTGALIVEVGRAGQWVGSLDLTVDLDAKKVKRSTFEMVPMDRSKIKPDEALTRQIEEWNKQYCPDAGEEVAFAPLGLPWDGGWKLGAAGRWLAEAIKTKTGADVVMLPRAMMRAGLPMGPVTADALFRMVPPRYAKPLVTFPVTGKQLLALADERVGGSGDHLVGVQLEVDKEKPAGQRVVKADVAAERQYTVVVPLPLIKAPASDPEGLEEALAAMGVKWTQLEDDVLDAAVAYARQQRSLRAPEAGP